VVSGLVHGLFEDSLFAVGSYLSVYFWVFVFLLADLIPVAGVVPLAVVSRAPRPSPASFGAVVPNRWSDCLSMALARVRVEAFTDCAMGFRWWRGQWMREPRARV